MEIRCICHPGKEAEYICQECGFLCAEHKSEEFTKQHLLINVSQVVKNLFTALSNKRKVVLLSLLLGSIKKLLLDYLEKEASKNDKAELEINAFIKKCKLAKFGFNARDICKHIDKIIDKDNEDIIRDKSKAVIDALISQLLTIQSKNMLCVTKAKENVLKGYNKYCKNERLGNLYN